MNTFVNLAFPTQGNSLPADHNYALYAAIASAIPELHHLEGLSINTISGIPDYQGKIALTSNSKLYLRIPATAISLVYPLTGKTLNISAHIQQPHR